MLVVFLAVSLLTGLIFCIYATYTGSYQLMIIGFSIAILAIVIFGGRDIIGKALYRQACNKAGGVTAIIQSQEERVCVNPDSIEYLEVES